MGEYTEYIQELHQKLKNYLVVEENYPVKVTVIVPCHNVEKYLEKCLDSLIKQTLKEIEIICVDDGSEDFTSGILNAYRLIDKRVKVITQKNQKQGAARNRGLEVANGEYVGFIDSDDWIDLDYYEKLYSTAKKYNSDIALVDYIRIGNGKTKKRLNIDKEEVYTTLEEKFNICKQAKHPCPTNKIYKKELLLRENISFPENVYSEDKIFTCKAVYYANSVVSVPNTYYYYYRRANSTVKTRDKKHVLDKINAHKEVLQFLRDKNVKLSQNDFWAVKKDYNKFGIHWYLIKESLKLEKHFLFGFIPVKKVQLDNEKLNNRHKKNEFKKLSKRKFNIEPYYSTDYYDDCNIDLYTITFNNSNIVEYQIKLIKKYLKGSFRHIICDNSYNEEAAKRIKEICHNNNVTYIRVHINKPSGYSDSHGQALNWVYKNIIKKRKHDFGFIDHDIFPIQEFNIEDYLKNNNLYGYIRKTGRIWYLWPTFSFFKYDFIKNYNLNFKKYRYLKIFHYNGADSGSGNWSAIYKHYDINKIPEVDCKYVDILKNNETPLWENAKTGYESYIQTNLSQYMDNGKWFHSICGSEWRDNVKHKNEIIYELLDKYLNDMQEASNGIQ